MRVFDGPKGVKLAYLPVSYCTETALRGSGSNPLGSVGRVTLQQTLVMLVLSNPGEHPPVLVGTAQQIKHGPALAGLDLAHQPGWVQTIVVPDGVARVVMRFTPPFLHHYSNTVQIHSNVGIVVRRPDYMPTTIIWYAADGHLIKRFVFRKDIALDNCLAHHRKDCIGPTLSAAQRYAIPLTVPADPQAKALYEPMIAYARATSVKQRSRSQTLAASVGTTLNRCNRPFQKQFSHLVIGSRNRAMQQREKVYSLWEHAGLMQTYQADVAPVALQLKQLASTWASLSLTNSPMEQFAHAVAAELTASLSAPPMNTCALVRGLMAHHDSYAWARSSRYGLLATRWWQQISSAGNRAGSFWKFVSPSQPGGPSGGAGQHLFTPAERSALSGLPGELG